MRYFFVNYTVVGVLLGVFGLTVNQIMPNILPGSFLSPTGGKFYIFGIHLKHWIYGLLILLIGSYQINRTDNSKYAKLYSFMIGLGGILVFDEIDDIYSFLQTGAL